jgi:ribosomal protein S18 acetylase RimI-like enzyme
MKTVIEANRRSDGLFVTPTREQIPLVAEFLDRCWKAEYRGIVDSVFLDSMVLSERTDGLLERFDSNASGFLLAAEDDAIIGVAVFGKSFTEGYADDGEVSAIYLEAAHIGTGLGSRLLAAAEAQLVSMGYVNLVLDVLADNRRAIRFYQKHGYEQVRDTEIELGGKAYPLVVMRKELSRESYEVRA